MLKKKDKKCLKIIVGTIITALALWLSFRKLDWGVLSESFSRVDYFWVTLAVLNCVFTVFILGLRWQVLLKPKAKISLFRLFRFNIISQYFNILVPARLGELARAYLASRNHKISGPYVVGTVAIEKVLDFLIFVMLWVSVPAVLAAQEVIKGAEIALFFCVVGLAFLILLIWKPGIFLKRTDFFLRVLPGKIRDKVKDFIENGINAFAQLRSGKTLIVVVFFTFIFIVGQVLTNFFLFKAFDLKLSFWVGLVVLLAIQAGNIPPSVPGKVGVFEYAVILALGVFGIAKTEALAYAVLLHLVAFLPMIVLGAIFITSSKTKLTK